ncbi:MAG: hypothetical protein L6N95_04770 [Candidatus Methylarchaceae archaeon HK01B]|nr:hypothetical protein [Candidatus Methylarchaceae archaeon HK01B]
MVRIVLTKFGAISENENRLILNIFHETFDRLQLHDRELIDVLLFERSSSLSAYLQQEHRKSGVVSDRFDDDFIAMHDAWRGIPRISVSMERLNQLPQQVFVGALRHEVGHAVLHGEVGYYLLPKPEAFDKLNMSKEYVANLLYLTSIAVKDYEVTRLLSSIGFENDQRAYVDYLLTPSDEDATTWLLAKRDRSMKVLFVVSCLKQLCSAIALNKEPSRPFQVQDVYPFLPERLTTKMNRILYEVRKFQVGRTIENIERLAGLIKEELI